MDKFVLTLDERKYLGFFVDTNGHNFTSNKSPITNYYYLDCEFVITDIGEELAILAIGNPETNQDYVIKVKPQGKIIDWISHITGLDDSTQWDMEFNDIIEFLKSLLACGDILIGHHLYNDLTKLNWFHPNIIDTCFMYPTPDGPPTYYSLKQLSKMYLKKNIQLSTHSPIEDAKTAYELVLWAQKNNYNKVNWARINESIVLDKSNIIDVITDSLKINSNKLYCVYTRGSRAVGTSKYNSDYDLVVICDKSCGIINGSLTCYANIDICIYDQEEFEKYLEFQYIWALECIYCPKNLIYLELIDFRKIAESYRKNNPTQSNDFMGRSIGYESGRKIASAKKHYLNGDYHQAKKHIFIAFRFIEYGIQIASHGKITNIRNANFIWFGLVGYKVGPSISFSEFEQKWSNLYVGTNRKLTRLIGKKNKSNNNLKLYNHVSFQRNFNFDLLIIKLIVNNQINDFLLECPTHQPTYANIINLYNCLKLKINSTYKEIITNNIISDKKDFSQVLNGYIKYLHKYLYLIHDNKSIELADLKFKPSKIYSDLMGNKILNNQKSIYKPIPKKEWIEYQNLNAPKIITTCTFDSDTVRFIGGLDISFNKNDDSKACGYLTIWDCVDKKIVWEDWITTILDIPYVSGFLGFREIDVYKKLINNVKLNINANLNINPKLTNFYPQVLFVDGNGILHHREFGSACQIGLELDIPTVGIAKTLLYHDGLDEFVIKKQFRSCCNSQGDWINLIGKTGKIYGRALKTSNDASNPIYISIGHKISLNIATELVIKTCIHKIPEPIRNSDIKSKLHL